MKSALVLGGCGFIGHHMARRLKSEGYWVKCVDIKSYEYGDHREFCDEWQFFDLRNQLNEDIFYHWEDAHTRRAFDEVYQFAALMGGAGFIFTGENDADIMLNSALININVLNTLSSLKGWSRPAFKGKIFYSSSACMYPQEIQNDYHNEGLRESDAYPANPDSDYGWEKLFSERLYLAYARNKGLDVRIARFHNIYGPEGTYKGGREKAPAAMCRKVIETSNLIDKSLELIDVIEKKQGGPKRETIVDASIDVWGTGHQTRSFLYIDDCIDAVRLLMNSDFQGPVNIGSEEMVTINQLANMAIDISGKRIYIKNIEGPVGVNGRNSNNDLIREKLGWGPKYSLREGMEKTFKWIQHEISNA